MSLVEINQENHKRELEAQKAIYESQLADRDKLAVNVGVATGGEAARIMGENIESAITTATIAAIWLRTPALNFTAVCEVPPPEGYAWKTLPQMLAMPRARSS